MLTERLRGELRCVRRLDGRRNTKGGREGKVAVMRAQYRDERSTDSRRRVRAPVLHTRCHTSADRRNAPLSTSSPNPSARTQRRCRCNPPSTCPQRDARGPRTPAPGLSLSRTRGQTRTFSPPCPPDCAATPALRCRRRCRISPRSASASPCRSAGGIVPPPSPRQTWSGKNVGRQQSGQKRV